MIGIVIPGADIFRLSRINLFVVLLPDISSSPPDPVDDVMNVLSEGTLHLFVSYNCWPKITLFRHWHWNCNIPEKTKSKFPNNYIILFCVFLLLRTWMPQLFISSSDVPTWYLSTRQLNKNGEFDCWNWNFEKAYSRIIVSSPLLSSSAEQEEDQQQLLSFVDLDGWEAHCSQGRVRLRCMPSDFLFHKTM